LQELGLEAEIEKFYKQNIQWNKALVLLASGDQSGFEKQLNEIISNPDHSFYGQASHLQKQMKSFFRKLAE